MEIKELCLNNNLRIPIEYRKDKESALSLLKEIKEKNYKINNSDLYVLADWVGYNFYEYNTNDEYSIIENIQPVGKSITYDLSILDGNSYTANGIICHNTLNLPAEATVQTVKEIFEKAWETGCKGITIYREGSRNGVLISSEEKEQKSFTLHSATKRPKELPCDVYHLSFRGDKYYVVVGLWDGKYPYEIFVGKNINLENDEPFIPKHISHGVVKKIKRGEYVLINGDEKEYQVSGELHDDIKESMTRFVSLSLRHGVDILFIVDILEKSKGDMLSFSKVMARTLKRYIKNGAEVSGKTCPSCGGENLIRESGCIQCIGCGWTMCS